MKVGTVGSGQMVLSPIIASLIANNGNVAEIYNPMDEIQGEPNYFDDAVIKYVNPYPLKAERKFICKGKHQYKEVRHRHDDTIIVEWICSCGRKTTD